MPGWVGPVAAISLLIIAFSYVAILLALGSVARRLADQANSISGELAEFRKELAPTLKYLGDLGREGADLADLAKAEVREVIDLSRRLRGDLDYGVRRTKRRLADLDALAEVIQEEVEETALTLGTVLHTVRTGSGLLGQVKRVLSPRSRRRR